MTAMMTVTGQMTLMKLSISLDAGVRCISTEIPVYLENGTINIKHPVARVSQHQLSFLFILFLILSLLSLERNCGGGWD